MFKKYRLRIPNYIHLFYNFKKKKIILKGIFVTKLLNLNLQLFINETTNIIKVTSIPFRKAFYFKRKKIKSFQGLIIAQIKQIIMESSSLLYQRLKFIGVGYRIFIVNSLKKPLLLIKVGYSHFIYFRKFLKNEVFCFKNAKLFLYGNCYQSLMKDSRFIRSYKKPEPYKGKGIFYEMEKMNLKEGKKI